MTGEHGIQNYSHRKQVRASIYAFIAQLLWSHVGWTSEHLSGHGQLSLVQLGNAEVCNFGMAILRDQNVCRFDIAMNDSLFMRIMECFGKLLRQAEGRAERFVEGLSLNILHHQVRRSRFRFFPYIENAHNAGM